MKSNNIFIMPPVGIRHWTRFKYLHCVGSFRFRFRYFFLPAHKNVCAMAKSANESLYYAVARRCTAMSRHVPACPGHVMGLCPVPRPTPYAFPATTTATTLYRLLFIYYLFDMLGVVADKEVAGRGLTGGWRRGWRYCPGRAFCQLVLGLLIFSTLSLSIF